MISIIICSRAKDISPSLKENISKTIGVDYELIVIDNSNNKYSIFEAYNFGIDISKGEYLCFMHDDIFFKTENWGKVINDVFTLSPDIGLIGVAGSKIKTKMPSGNGWSSGSPQFSCLHIIQSEKDGSDSIEYNFGFSCNKILEDVVVIDGVFMVYRKTVGVKFNESLRGFHNYDLSFSIDVFIKKYRVVLTNMILIEHFSKGMMNSDWVKAALKFHVKYKVVLPLAIEGIDVCKEDEVAALKSFVKRCFMVGEFGEGLSSFNRLVRYSPSVLFHFKYLLKLIFSALLFLIKGL